LNAPSVPKLSVPLDVNCITQYHMFGSVIERWVALAAFSDNTAVRQGNHTRASDWPEHLIHAENDRMHFDVRLCWAIASQLCDHEHRALAFAMGTHSRLGELSPALSLVSDIVHQISRSELLPPVDELYRHFLRQHSVASLLMSAGTAQQRMFRGVPVHTQMQKPLLIRRLLQSEFEDRKMYKWPRRSGIFFCRRGWFAGVDILHAPVDAQDSTRLVGIFESIPHVFCDVWFPVCRPFAVCMHLLHVSFMASPVADAQSDPLST